MNYLKNHFLIAMPALGDPNFAESVTYICKHDAEGAIGLIINKPSELTIGEVFAELELEISDNANTGRPVLNGGPVEQARGFVLHRSDHEYESTIEIDAMIKLTASRDILVEMARGAGPDLALLALGYAGWGAGQLESELAANAWLSTAATAELIFELPFEQRWVAAARLIGVDINSISNYAGHA